MDEKKTVEDLDQALNEQTFAAGDAWLRGHGVLSKIAHNAIVANLYVNFPKVRYLEYFLPEDTERKKVWVRLYVPFWKLLFSRRERMIDNVIVFLRDYLKDYDIKVELKRYKKGVEKSNEIPKPAIDHVAPPELQPEAGAPTGSPVPAAAPVEARGDDPGSAQAAASGAGDVPALPDSADPGDPKPSV